MTQKWEDGSFLPLSFSCDLALNASKDEFI